MNGTGMHFTPAGCNVNTCGAREVLEKYMAEGRSDREILLKLKKKRGRDLRQPPLLRQNYSTATFAR